jgi:hypothetical protein
MQSQILENLSKLLGRLVTECRKIRRTYWVRFECGCSFISNDLWAKAQSRKTTIHPVAPDFLITMANAVEGTIFLGSTHKTGRCVFFKLAYESRKVNAAIGGSWNYTFKCWEYKVLGSVPEALHHVEDALAEAGIAPVVHMATT